MLIKEGFVRIDSLNLYVSEMGEGYPIIMLHGGGPGASGMSNFSKNVEVLAQKYRVIVPDLKGYGRSTKGVDRMDPFGDNADAIFGLMQSLNIPSAHLIGNSLGGAVALRMALDFPSAVTSLVLNGPGGVGTTRAFPTEGLNCLLDYYNGKGPTLEKMRTFIKEYLVYDSSSVSEKVIQERYESSIDPEVMASPPLRRPNGIPDFRKWDFTRDPRLNECRIPSLIIWGIEDKVNRPSGAEMLQSRMKNCDVYLFSKTGHWVQWERPEEFNGVTLSFLNCSTPKVK